MCARTFANNAIEIRMAIFPSRSKTVVKIPPNVRLQNLIPCDLVRHVATDHAMCHCHLFIMHIVHEVQNIRNKHIKTYIRHQEVQIKSTA